jgi:hypothetical protein
MALKATLDTLDDVAEGTRDFYDRQVIKDASGNEKEIFAIGIEGIESHPQVLALRNALERKKDEVARQKSDIASLTAQLEATPATDRDFKKLASGLKDSEAKIATQRNFIQRLLVSEGLAKELIVAGVDQRFVPAATALLGQNVKLIERGEEYAAVIVDRYGTERELTEYTKDWVESGEGKIFAASEPTTESSQGRSPRHNQPSGPNPFSKADWNMTDQGAIMKKDRAQADRLAKAAGHKDAASAKLPAAK